MWLLGWSSELGHTTECEEGKDELHLVLTHLVFFQHCKWALILILELVSTVQHFKLYKLTCKCTVVSLYYELFCLYCKVSVWSHLIVITYNMFSMLNRIKAILCLYLCKWTDFTHITPCEDTYWHICFHCRKDRLLSKKCAGLWSVCSKQHPIQGYTIFVNYCWALVAMVILFNLYFDSYLKVFQLVGHLVYWGKATIIFPLCETNEYILSPRVPTER